MMEDEEIEIEKVLGKEDVNKVNIKIKKGLFTACITIEEEEVDEDE